MYSKLFENIGLERGSLGSYEGSYLKAFNGTTSRLWGYIELMIYAGEVKDDVSINSYFFVVPYKIL